MFPRPLPRARKLHYVQAGWAAATCRATLEIIELRPPCCSAEADRSGIASHSACYLRPTSMCQPNAAPKCTRFPLVRGREKSENFDILDSVLGARARKKRKFRIFDIVLGSRTQKKKNSIFSNSCLARGSDKNEILKFSYSCLARVCKTQRDVVNFRVLRTRNVCQFRCSQFLLVAGARTRVKSSRFQASSQQSLFWPQKTTRV